MGGQGLILRELTREQAKVLLSGLWWGGKNSGAKRVELDHTSNHDGSGYVEVRMPLSLVRGNENGERYDGTVNIERARLYAQGDELAPVHLLYGARLEKLGKVLANVNDGGHRVSAARMRGDTDIKAIMQRSDFDRLLSVQKENMLNTQNSDSFVVIHAKKKMPLGGVSAEVTMASLVLEQAYESLPRAQDVCRAVAIATDMERLGAGKVLELPIKEFLKYPEFARLHDDSHYHEYMRHDGDTLPEALSAHGLSSIRDVIGSTASGSHARAMEALLPVFRAPENDTRRQEIARIEREQFAQRLIDAVDEVHRKVRLPVLQVGSILNVKEAVRDFVQMAKMTIAHPFRFDVELATGADLTANNMRTATAADAAAPQQQELDVYTDDDVARWVREQFSKDFFGFDAEKQAELRDQFYAAQVVVDADMMADFAASQWCEGHTGRKWADLDDSERDFWRDQVSTAAREWRNEAQHVEAKQNSQEVMRLEKLVSNLNDQDVKRLERLRDYGKPVRHTISGYELDRGEYLCRGVDMNRLLRQGLIDKDPEPRGGLRGPWLTPSDTALKVLDFIAAKRNENVAVQGNPNAERIILASDFEVESAEEFVAFLTRKGHVAEIGKEATTSINGISIDRDERTAEVLREHWNDFCIDGYAADAYPDTTP